MSQIGGTVPVHCYTNPSFCRQSEYIPEDRSNEDLPPPPQFQGNEDLPPPPPPLQIHYNGGQCNPGFQGQNVNDSRYCYLDDDPHSRSTVSHRRYNSLPVPEDRTRYTYNQSSRYEYIEDEDEGKHELQRRNTTRYDFVPKRHTEQHQQVQRFASPANQNEPRARNDVQVQTYRNNNGRYAPIPGEIDYHDEEPIVWNEDRSKENPPALPDRNNQDLSVSPKHNLATQKLHEILSTPRKTRSRSRSEERTVSPRRHQSFTQTGTPQRRALTPVGSPSRAFSPGRLTPQGNRMFSPNACQTSTPNKEPSARRCLPLQDHSSRNQDLYSTGRLRYVGTAPMDLVSMGHQEPPPRYYAYGEKGAEIVPMISGSPRYHVVSVDEKTNAQRGIENAFLARTAVVPPLSPMDSDANTTLMSAYEKSDRRNAPLLLVLVGILTCGLAIYLSWTQGRRYYFDSAVVCGACCTFAGACRSLRKTWTGLGLAGLSSLSCAGLLLLASKSPKPGTPLHDITAGALCGVSLLGAILALFALMTPRCSLSRHRRVHSWLPRSYIPGFSP